MAVKRKVLGKGLNALLPTGPASGAQKSLQEIPIDQVIPNKYQPRSNFDPEQLKELSQSIKSNGVVQPVIVRRAGGSYQLIAGERRWRAAKLAGLKNIPAVIRDVSEYKTLELALIENIQRQDLNPIEEATAFSSLIDDFGLTQEEVALRVGKDRSSVANYIRLLKLPDEIKEQIQRQQLSMGHARALSSLEKMKDQLALAAKIISEQLNVRQTELLIRNWKGNRKSSAPATPEEIKVDPNVRAAELKLQERFGTKVVIAGSSDKGRIEIYYENAEDLIRIFELMTAGAN
ncbi:MAG: chromosome partitioning protein ParB [Acidobacteria bacterium]|nr:MAG: chromosome partitioning protein ParB [Acidobacteriota bacterium]